MDVQKIIENLQDAIVSLQMGDSVSCIVALTKAAKQLGYALIIKERN